MKPAEHNKDLRESSKPPIQVPIPRLTAFLGKPSLYVFPHNLTFLRRQEMSEVIYPTSTKVRGPLLLGSESLIKLDAILAQHKPVLIALRSKRIEEYVSQETLEAQQSGRNAQEIEERKDYWVKYAERTVSPFSQTLTLYLSDGGQLEAESFADASAHLEFAKVVPEGFRLVVRSEGIRVTLVADSDSLETEMKLDVSPNNSEGAKNMFADLRRWMRSVQASRWQQWWCSLGHARFIIWLLVLTVGFIAVAASSGSGDQSYYRQQAQDLVRQGVSSSNQYKAIETMLALVGKVPAPSTHALSHWFWFFLIGTLIVAAILSYPPKLVLGLGQKGDEHIKLWRAWTRFVFVVIPTFIASNFLWPYVSQLLKKWFP